MQPWRHRKSEWLYVDVRIGGGEAGEVVCIAGQDHPTPGLDGRGDDMGVNHVRGTGARGGQHASDVGGQSSGRYLAP